MQNNKTSSINPKTHERSSKPSKKHKRVDNRLMLLASKQPHLTHNKTQKSNQDQAYREAIEQLQIELPRSTRGFSRFIHHPLIESLSDWMANTIARPDALLAGSVAAFVLVLAVYSYAKYAGFALQGSETIIAFGLGWALGIVFDVIKRIFSRTD